MFLMVKRHRIYLVMVVLVGVCLMAGSYYGRVGSAQPLAAPTWSSGFQIQNLDPANPATVTIIYRDQNGSSVVYQSGLSIRPGGSTTIFPLPVSGFDGSVEIQSDRPVAAIANLLTENPTMLDSYVGVTSPGTQAFLPLIMRDNSGYSTTVYIQNTGSAQANVTLEYRRTGSPNVVKTRSLTIAAGGRATVRQFEDDTDLGSGWIGSIRVSSDQPVATVVTQSNGSILFSYNGFSQGSQQMYLPLVMCGNSGWCTGLQAMNVGSAPVTITLKVDGVDRGKVSLGPYESKTWYPVPPGNMTSRHVGSAVLEASGGQIVAIVNELNSGLNQGMSYVGFSGGTSTVNLPLVMTNNSYYQVGVQIQNLGPNDVKVQVRAVSNDGVVARDDSVTVPGNGSTTLYPAVGSIPGPRFVGSMTIRGPAGSQLVAIANQITYPQQPGDTSAVYNGFNQ